MRQMVTVVMLAALAARAGEVTVETERFRLVLGEDACAKSLVVKATGEECVPKGAAEPFFSVTQERPFQNEDKLAHPNRRTEYGANRIRREGDVLVVGFAQARYEAEIAVKEAADYATFTLKGFRKAEDCCGSLHVPKPPASALRIAKLPVKARANYGDWLEVVWDDRAAVSVLSTSPDVRIGSEGRGNSRVLTADLERGRRFVGGTAALVAAPGREAFLDCVDAIERDFNLPRGVKSRRGPLINASIMWVPDLSPANVDAYVEQAKKGGFRLMLVYYTSLVNETNTWHRCGEWAFRDTYPNGFEDVRSVLDKVKAAGIAPGIHFLQTHIGLLTSYVTPVADHRLALTRHFTLAKPLGTGNEDVFVEENPVDSPTIRGMRVLRFGGELIAYEGYTTERPYRFTGVRRGEHRTNVVPHPLGEIGGVLDLSEYGYPGSCYVDQESSLSEEIADRIAAFWKCGFRFVYMDGSEGVKPPMDRNIAVGQYNVWKKLDPPPVFGEAAAKSNFGWHMLSGGNAFDVFPPSYFKSGIDRHPLREAGTLCQDFTRVNFGWWSIFNPTMVAKKPKNAPGTQPDMWEYGTSKAAAWDCPVTVQCVLADALAHPRIGDLLEVLRRWEDVRARKWLTPEQKKALRTPKKEFHLYVNGQGGYELHEIEMLPVPENARELRGFVFERSGRRTVACWHTCGAGTARITLGDGGAPMTLNVSDMKYLETDLPKDAVITAFAAASWCE